MVMRFSASRRRQSFLDGLDLFFVLLQRGHPLLLALQHRRQPLRVGLVAAVALNERALGHLRLHHGQLQNHPLVVALAGNGVTQPVHQVVNHFRRQFEVHEFLGHFLQQFFRLRITGAMLLNQRDVFRVVLAQDGKTALDLFQVRTGRTRILVLLVVIVIVIRGLLGLRNRLIGRIGVNEVREQLGQALLALGVIHPLFQQA